MKNGLTSLIYLLITVNTYRFCISVIGYLNMQIIGIGYKNNILVAHYSRLNATFKNAMKTFYSSIHGRVVQRSTYVECLSFPEI